MAHSTVSNFQHRRLATINFASIFAAPKEETRPMLIIPVKEGESIDKVLKKFKKKFERTQTMRQLRRRQAFIKPSIVRRKEMIRAAYKLTLQTDEQ
jgi:small subunit ribosomal protein S21